MSKVQHDSEVPAHGQQVLTACAFIYREVNDGIEVFMPLRASTKKFLPSIYELPGGRVDFGEDMKVGLKREIMEEFGVQIEVGECFDVFTYKNEIKGTQSLEALYFAKFLEPEESIKLHPEDHSEYIWVNEYGLEEIVKNKGESDDEVKSIYKGFEILNSEFSWVV